MRNQIVIFKKNILYIFILLMSLFSISAHSDDNVLLVFEMKNNFVVTSQSLLEGMKIAENQYLKKDKKNKNRLNYILVKTTQDLKDVAETTNHAIKEHKPIAIIGAITSNVAFVLSDIAEREKIPFITPFATHSKVTENKEFTFRTCFDDQYQAKMLAKFVYQYKKKRRGIILINETFSYAIGLKDDFEKFYKSFGGKIDSVFTFVDPKDVDDKFIQKIKEISPEFIFMPSYQIEAAALISKMIGKIDKETLFIGPDSWAGGHIFNEILKQNKDKFRGFYVQHWSSELKSQANKNFMSLMEKHK